MTTPTTYDLGDLVRVTGTFTTAAGVAADPTTVKLDYRKPTSTTTTTLTYGTDAAVIKSTTGVYYADLNADTEGLWYYRWYGTGTGQSADEGSFIVGADIAQYVPLVLTRGEDYGMIRHYLNLSLTDLTGAEIEQPNYLPWVEGEVTAVFTTYATILSTGGANAYRLKTGVAAWTASLLCQFLSSSMSAGGVQIGDYSERGASLAEWQSKARDLLLLAAQALAGISTRTFTRMSLVKLAGPTRSGGDIPHDEEEWLEKIQPRILDWIEEGGEDD